LPKTEYIEEKFKIYADAAYFITCTYKKSYQHAVGTFDKASDDEQSLNDDFSDGSKTNGISNHTLIRTDAYGQLEFLKASRKTRAKVF